MQEIANPPSDGISSLQFSPQDDQLLVASWDSHVYLYDEYAQQRSKVKMKAAVLDATFGGKSHGTAYAVGLDHSLTEINLDTTKQTHLGSHQKPIRCVRYSAESNQLYTGSWDRYVKQWDPRAANPEIAAFHQIGKIFSIDTIGNTLVVASSARTIYIYDTRKMQEPVEKRESWLKYMTRAVRCMPNGEGYVNSSTEGRVAVEYFNHSEEAQARKYAFKCHRKQTEMQELVYPVNAIEFHPHYEGSFATGGGDGLVCVWDGNNKKRLRQLQPFPTSISALAYNQAGTILAIASSYTFEEGEKDHPPDSIFLRTMSDSDCKPRLPK